MEPYHKTREWHRLLKEALERDAYQCTVRGCRARATHVDYIVSRDKGGPYVLQNLRSFCAAHDSRTKTF
jgi:5-methylcytosine-specific restriction endonuclease McrA